MKLDPSSSKFRFIVGAVLILGGIFFNFAETAYFGWNLKPSCPAEIKCDYVSQVMIVSGMLIEFYINMFQKGE